MSNTITIELCAEDRARLDGILAALTNHSAPNACTGLPEVAPEIPAEEPKQEAPAAPAEDAAPFDTKEEPEQPTVTAADIQAKVRKLLAPTSTKREQAKKLVKSYAERVSEIPPAKYNEVMRLLTELEGA